MRVATEEGALSIRLPDDGDYAATLRLDPFPRPLREAPARLPVVEVLLNGIPITTIALQWSPGRVGAYDVVFPRAAVRRGSNLLVLRVRRPAESAATIRPGLTDGDAVGLWYLRVRPPAGAPHGRGHTIGRTYFTRLYTNFSSRTVPSFRSRSAR